MSFIVIITTEDGRFNCVLDDKPHGTKKEALDALVAAKEEDKREGWNYRYQWYHLED